METKVKYQISSQKNSLEELTVAHHCHSAISHLQRAISYYNAGMDEPLDWALDAAFREVLAVSRVTKNQLRRKSGKMLRKSAELYAPLRRTLSQHYLATSTRCIDFREFSRIPVSYF